jgi:exonuclease VII large subunit
LIVILKNQQAFLLNHKKILFLLSKEQTLKRGFALIKNKGQVVNSSSSLSLQDPIEIEMQDALIEAVVVKIIAN